MRYSFRGRGRHACASAAPRDLKIASRTFAASSPWIRRTCSVSTAPSASSRRKRSTTSNCRPPTWAGVRSTFETTSGRSEASSATWASASQAGTVAEPKPRALDECSSSRSASPSARPAAATSSSAPPGATSSRRPKPPVRAISSSRWSRTGRPVETADSEPPSDARTRSPVGVSLMPATLVVAALDVRAERAEPLVDPLVAAVDLGGVADRRGALGAERGEQHRHAGADVRAGHALAVQLGRAGHDHAVRVAEDDPGAHRDELVDEEQAALEHLLEDQDRPPRLGRDHDRDRRHVGREGGPRAVLDLRDRAAEVVADRELLTRRDVDRGAVDLEAQPEPLEHREHRDEVVGRGVLNGEVAAGDGGHADEAADLDVVGGDRVLAAAQPLDARDVDHVRADALDLGAEADEEAAEVLDVRLARRVRDRRP